MSIPFRTILNSFTVCWACLVLIGLGGTQWANAGGTATTIDPPFFSIKQRADQLVSMTQPGYHTALFSTTPKEKFSFASKPRVAADPLPCSLVCRQAVIQYPDLTAILLAQPSTVNGTTPMSLVVNVYELNVAPTTGPIKVYISKDPLLPLSFDPTATTIGNRPVQNSLWSFDALSDPAAYVLTTTQTTGVSGKLSVGLSGQLAPGNTKGNLSISAMVEGSGVGELKITNNADSERVDYFNK